jgi:hypothetical protein
MAITGRPFPEQRLRLRRSRKHQVLVVLKERPVVVVAAQEVKTRGLNGERKDNVYQLDTRATASATAPANGGTAGSSPGDPARAYS